MSRRMTVWRRSASVVGRASSDRSSACASPPPLADPRLEALRRLGVAARLGTRRIVEREINRARTSGFTSFQIDAVLGRFGLAPTEFHRS